MTNQLKAKLRVCASCEWIFKYPEQEHSEWGGCPKCGFCHYGARYVYGDAAYRHAITQKPWLDNRVAKFTLKLYSEITAWNIEHKIGKSKADGWFIPSLKKLSVSEHVDIVV